MRLNCFFGISNSFYYISDLIKDDPRVASPCVVNLLYTGNQWVNPARRLGLNRNILTYMFNYTNNQECNIAHHLSEDSSTPLVLLKRSVRQGSRFWFVIPKDIEKFVDDHIKFFEPVKNDKLMLIQQTFNTGSFDKNILLKKCYETVAFMNGIADEWGAGPETEFDLKDYFEDNISRPTDFITRLYTTRKN